MKFSFCFIIFTCIICVKSLRIHDSNKLLKTTKLSSSLITSDNLIKPTLAENVLNSVFKIKPFYKFVSDKARQMIIDRGSKIGVDWDANVAVYESDKEKLCKIYDQLTEPSLNYPSYYVKPFHAYENGNLCWEAAMEVESAALTVHSPIFANNPKEPDINGDSILRSNFHNRMTSILSEYQFKPKKILDIGCSGGLSTLKLRSTFPDANIVGLDYSPYMLSVAKYNLDKLAPEDQKKISYLHAAGEDTTLGKGDIDMVSMCLICHELPTHISSAIFSEAYKILPPGGALTIMDMNPNSKFFQKFSSNVLAFAAFKSTEPWIQEYSSMDILLTLSNAGFADVKILENSPRHRTIVAFK